MKRLTSIAVLLTIAAALATTVISCTSDDDLTAQPAEPAVEQPAIEPRTVHVTVGAGISNGDATRSAVVKDGTTRTLTFTAGDRLFIYATIVRAENITMTGYLTLDETPAEGATTATFSGDLTVYKWSWDDWKDVEYAYTFSASDPLSECEEVTATLVHRDAVGYESDEHSSEPTYNTRIAPTVDELMTTILSVQGGYDAATKSFSLSSIYWEETETPIFNCTISGLAPGTTYTVKHFQAADFEDALMNAIPDDYSSKLGKVTSDGDGTATFACYVINVYKPYHLFTFTDESSNRLNVYLGAKSLGSKVYNVARQAVVFRAAPFSVSDSKQVYFSPGNLKVKKGYSGWYWIFQDYQWQYVGTSGGNQKINGSMSLSTDATDDDYIDLFGWNGASASDDNYGIYDSYDYDDYGSTNGEDLKHDWGHNAIGDDPADTWRTPTKSEWEYLLSERNVTNSLSDGARYTMATIDGKYKGLILFPDSYTHPSGAGYTAGTYNAPSDYTTAVTFEFWMQMENAGCIFLPAAGSRWTTMVFTDAEGYYWSSSSVEGSAAASNVRFTKKNVDLQGSSRVSGYSVRLVRDAE